MEPRILVPPACRRLAVAPQGRLIIEQLETAGIYVTAATLPVEGSCCFVRHAPRSDAWAGPWPWQQGGADEAAVEEIGFIVVVIEGAKCAPAALPAHRRGPELDSLPPWQQWCVPLTARRSLPGAAGSRSWRTGTSFSRSSTACGRLTR